MENPSTDAGSDDISNPASNIDEDPPTPKTDGTGPTTWVGSQDADHDGYTASDGDCDDTTPLVGPGFPELPDDGLDNDCQGDGDWVASDQTGVFVSIHGTPGGPGTQENPISDLEAAFVLAEQRGAVVFATTGVYQANLSFSGKLFGGYNSTDWSRDPLHWALTLGGGGTVIDGGQELALLIGPDQHVLIDGVSVLGARGPDHTSPILIEGTADFRRFESIGDACESTISSQALVVNGGTVTATTSEFQGGACPEQHQFTTAAIQTQNSTLILNDVGVDSGRGISRQDGILATASHLSITGMYRINGFNGSGGYVTGDAGTSLSVSYTDLFVYAPDRHIFSTDGDMELDHVHLAAGGWNEAAHILNINGSAAPDRPTLTLRNTDITASHSNTNDMTSFILAASANVVLEDCWFHVDQGSGHNGLARVVNATNSTITSVNNIYEVLGDEEIYAIYASEDSILASTDDTISMDGPGTAILGDEVTVTRLTVLNAEKAIRATVGSLTNSTVTGKVKFNGASTILNNTITVTDHVTEAVFVAEGSEVRNNTITFSESNGIGSGIMTAASSVEISGNVIEVSGCVDGCTGILNTASQADGFNNPLLVKNNHIDVHHCGSSAEAVCRGFAVESIDHPGDAVTELINNVWLIGHATDHATGIEASVNDYTYIVNNTVVFGDTVEAIGIWAVTGSTVEAVNTLVHSESTLVGVAGDSASFRLQANAFSALNELVLSSTTDDDSTDEVIEISEFNECHWAGCRNQTGGNLTVDSTLVDAAGGDVHLVQNSSCIDMGIDPSASFYAGNISDLDGEPRPMGGGWDIGADEVAP